MHSKTILFITLVCLKKLDTYTILYLKYTEPNNSIFNKIIEIFSVMLILTFSCILVFSKQKFVIRNACNINTCKSFKLNS